MMRRLLAVLLLLSLVPAPVLAAGSCAIYRSWNTGDTLTASDLTQSFVVVGQTNMVPACIDDYSADVTQMQSAVDPYPGGTESLATSLQGELERLRFVIKKATGWSQWYKHTEGPTKPTQTFRGLHLRTHPDADKAVNQVMLVHADEIVLDDGTRVGPWDNLVADITLSGAGGLDTGTEAASAWYEIYAIRRSSDGAKNLLLHRAKEFFLDQQQTSSPTSIAFRDSVNTTKLAQSFQVATAGRLAFVQIRLAKTGSPTGLVWLTVEADQAGAPSGTPLATTDKLDASSLTSIFGFFLFPFRVPASLATGTTYWLVLNSDVALSGTHYLNVGGDSANVYANGKFRGFNGSSWSDTVTIVDAAFKVAVVRNDTAVAMPTGWDQQARIGWVYNNSVSNLNPFVARDRLVHPLVNLGGFATTTSTTPVLVDLSGAIPPVRVTLRVGYGNSAAGNFGLAGPVPDGYVTAGGSTFRAGGAVAMISTRADSAAVETVSGGALTTEYQALYVYVGGGTGRFWLSEWEW